MPTYFYSGNPYLKWIEGDCLDGLRRFSFWGGIFNLRMFSSLCDSERGFFNSRFWFLILKKIIPLRNLPIKKKREEKFNGMFMMDPVGANYFSLIC